MRALTENEIDAVHGGELEISVGLGPFEVSGTIKDWYEAAKSVATSVPVQTWYGLSAPSGYMGSTGMM